MQHVSLLHSTCRLRLSFPCPLYPNLHFDTYSIKFFVKKCLENACLEFYSCHCNFATEWKQHRDNWTYLHEDIYSVAIFTFTGYYWVCLSGKLLHLKWIPVTFSGNTLVVKDFRNCCHIIVEIVAECRV
jgi:hypothetical protein